MKKYHMLCIAAVLLFPGALSPLYAKKDLPELDFFVGRYEVAGRYPDAQKTYAGTVVITRDGDALVVRREIGGRKISGRGVLKKALCCDDVYALSVVFTDGGIDYECSYLIQSDLDNYPRLSGYVYRKDGKTKQAGIEVLFAEQNNPGSGSK